MFEVCLQEVFGLNPSIFIKCLGLLTLEHCGIPSREHDGMCLTTVYVVPPEHVDKLRNVQNDSYAWYRLSDGNLIHEIKARVLDKNLLIPLVGS